MIWLQCIFLQGKKTDLEVMIDLFKKQPENLISPFRTTQWAIALITLDRLCEADIILSEYIKKDPSDLFINSALAILLTKKGDNPDALKKIEYCERSNLNTGHFHHAVYNLAIAYALLGRFQKIRQEAYLGCRKRFSQLYIISVMTHCLNHYINLLLTTNC